MSLNILAKKREDYSEKKQEADDAIYSLGVDKAYYVDSISYKTDNTASSFDETD
jgi:hypothetical protein